MLMVPGFPGRVVHGLDGVWDFAFLGDTPDPAQTDLVGLAFGDRMAVPGCFDATPAYAGRRGTAAYRTTVSVTPGIRGLLRCGGLGMWARVFVDGVPLGVIDLPYSGFTLPVPAAAHREREVLVLVDNRFDANRVPLMEPFFDFYCYGGIYRSVEWHELPSGPVIDGVEVAVADLAAGTVRLRVRLLAPWPERVDLDVTIDGVPVRELRNAAPDKEGHVDCTATVPDPTPWSPARPVLHTCSVRCGTDRVTERFGLRTVGVRDGLVTINGTAVKLLGYCRHEAHPQFGPALPLQQLVQDLQILRDLGCNFVRGSHYPQDPRFLNLCDEAGILVFEESLGWGQKPEHFSRSGFHDAQLRQTRAMVRNSFNHPCVVLWGFLNEGASHTPESRTLYADLAAEIRALDRSRLVTYASMHPFDDRNFDLADVISVNTYPGWYAQDRNTPAPCDEIVPRLTAIRQHLDRHGFADKPLLISEIGAGAIYGWHDPLEAHWTEEYQERYLDIVCRHVCENPRLAGVALWQFCDCRTYAGAMALTRPRAFNNKGTLDEYRRPKLAYRTVKRHFGNVPPEPC
ncbi:MAG: beta-galactosidase [Lentisphaeria bacterium]|nr:beta-galactosidase [Lentisphaeria bacterium]